MGLLWGYFPHLLVVHLSKRSLNSHLESKPGAHRKKLPSFFSLPLIRFVASQQIKTGM